MSFEFPRPNEPIAEGGAQPMRRSWIQWLRDFARQFYEHWIDDTIHFTMAALVEWFGGVSLEPTGYVDRTQCTIACDGTTRVFTVAPVGASFTFYIHGKEYVKTTAQTCTIPDLTGTHFVYFDSTGTLTSSQTAWSFTDAKAFTALVYRKVGGTARMIMEERHGIGMDGVTHTYLHSSVSMRYVSGFGGTFAASNTFTMAEGVVLDEDIRFDVAAKTQCRIIHRDGTGAWNFSAGGTAFYLETAGVIQWDNSAATPTVTDDVGAAQFVAYWIYATNDTEYPIWSIVGQRTDSNIANARANNLPSSLVLTGLPSPEMKLLYRVIIQRSGTSETISEVTDYRNISSVPVGSYVGTSHLSLTDLNSAGYYHLTQTDHTDLTDGGDTTLHQHTRYADKSQDGWTVVQAAGSADPAFQNSWVNYTGIGYATAAYYRDDFGIVHLRGLVRNGSSIPTTIFTLEATYWPATSENFSVPTYVGGVDTGAGVVVVTASGEVRAVVGGTTYISLNGISFRAAGY